MLWFAALTSERQEYFREKIGCGLCSAIFYKKLISWRYNSDGNYDNNNNAEQRSKK